MIPRPRLAALVLSAAALVPAGTAQAAHAAPAPAHAVGVASHAARPTLAAGSFRAGTDLAVTATGVGARAVVTGPRGMRAVLTRSSGSDRLTGRIHVPAGLRATWIRIRVSGANGRTAAVVVRAAKPARGPITGTSARRATMADPSTTIAAAVRRSPLLGAVRPADARVANVRVAADGRWASARVSSARGVTDPAQVLLARSGSQWRVMDLGTGGVGCGIVGQATRTRLGLTGSC